MFISLLRFCEVLDVNTWSTISTVYFIVKMMFVRACMCAYMHLFTRIKVNSRPACFSDPAMTLKLLCLYLLATTTQGY